MLYPTSLKYNNPQGGAVGSASDSQSVSCEFKPHQRLQ